MNARGWYPDRTGARYVHVPLGKGKGRKSVRLNVTTDEAADKRAALVREIASTLLEAGQQDDALDWATKAVEGDEERAKKILAFAQSLAKGQLKKARPTTGLVTFKDVGAEWTSGKLAKSFPDQVNTKRTADHDAGRLEWLCTTGGLGDVPIAALTIEHAEGAMQKLAPALRSATRRQYAQVLRRVMELAVYPLRHIATNPIPRGSLPRIKQNRALMCLWPDEEAKYLAHRPIPLEERIACGFLARMGFRKSEALGGDAEDGEEPAPPLTWDRVDLARGVVFMARSKTEKPRPIALAIDVVRALTRWREMRPAHVHVFADLGDTPTVIHAREYRDWLKKAGVTRAELHDVGRDTLQLRVHDLRALFVTTSIAQGKPQDWIRDRTAHKTLSMLDRYRRQARMFEELNLGPLAPLDEAIPELKAVGDASDGGLDGNGSRWVDTGNADRSASYAAPAMAKVTIENPRVPGSIPGVGTAT